MKRFLVMILAAVMLCLTLAGCSDSLVGTWEGGGDYLELRGDGTCDVNGAMGLVGIAAGDSDAVKLTWSQEGSDLVITCDILGFSQSMSWGIVEHKGNRLVLDIDGSEVELTRV